MKYRNIKFKININYLLIMFFFFLGIEESNAQLDSKKKLDDYNKKNTFPTGQVDDYGSCLDNLYAYYKAQITLEQNLNRSIKEVDRNLEKNKKDLEGAKDSTSKVALANLDTQLKSKKDSLIREIKKIDYNFCQTTLRESYPKIIAYYSSFNDPKAEDWKKKFDTFKEPPY